MEQKGQIYSKEASIRLSVPFGIQDGDSSASIMTSKEENLLLEFLVMLMGLKLVIAN